VFCMNTMVLLTVLRIVTLIFKGIIRLHCVFAWFKSFTKKEGEKNRKREPSYIGSPTHVWAPHHPQHVRPVCIQTITELQSSCQPHIVDC
jgi:hypothetical protein